MASANETPRQKMIGLMYLVLMALLAINVSKDVLDAFVAVNTGLQHSKSNLEIQNKSLYDEIAFANNLDPIKTKNVFETSLKIKEKTKNLLFTLDSIKKAVIAKTEGLSDLITDTISLDLLEQKDNYDVPTEMMIGSDEHSITGLSRQLRLAIEQFDNHLKENVTDESFNSGLSLKGGKAGDQFLNWELYNFHHTPLVATVAILSKLENDVVTAEYKALTKLYASIGKNDFPIDTIAPKVSANTGYVLLGENYEADVFLAAYSTTQAPVIEINDSLLKVEQGIGKYKLKASKEGLHTYQGVIRIKDKSGNEKSYPFENQYIVNRPSATVSPIRMNVLYAGIENPISVAVPGFTSDQIEVEINHGSIKKTANGIFSTTPPLQRLPNVGQIKIYAKVNGVKKLMGTQDFRFKRIPRPKLLFCGKQEQYNINKITLRNAPNLNVVYGEDFLFDGRAKIIEATLLYKNIEVKLDKGVWNNQVKEIMKRINPGESFLFYNIKATGMDGREILLENVTVRVI